MNPTIVRVSREDRFLWADVDVTIPDYPDRIALRGLKLFQQPEGWVIKSQQVRGAYTWAPAVVFVGPLQRRVIAAILAEARSQGLVE